MYQILFLFIVRSDDACSRLLSFNIDDNLEPMRVGSCEPVAEVQPISLR